jgi:signal transduction histidine kinase
MQTGLTMALKQKTRPATLGEAVTKINHDLRNILATARLISDRLATIDDPEARRITPTLVSSIDRAVELCTDTLDFARAERPLALTRFALRDLVADVGEQLGFAVDGAPAWENLIDPATIVAADRGQLSRVLANLGKNAAQAGAEHVRISARREGEFDEVEIADDGPGLPPKAQARLFEPFAGSARPGGTGLGLAMVRELMRSHGGDVILARTGADGTAFELRLPVGQGNAIPMGKKTL